MNKPQAVIFDLGKVLVDFDWAGAARRIQTYCDATVDQIATFINYSPLVIQFETGRLTTERFFQEVRQGYGFRGTLEQFSAAFGDIFTPIDPMIQLHAALRERGVPTYIFSNTNEIAVRTIRRRFPFFAHFDGYVLSYEHGVMKPDAGLYEIVERLSGLRGVDLFYVDDRPENVAAGLARGWRGIVHESSENTRAAFAQVGLPG
jgi:HAD superfamily hydrolase (TIGR01509 family)